MSGDTPDRPARGPASRCLCFFGKCLTCRQVHTACAWCWRAVKLAAFVVFFLWAFGIPGSWLADEIGPHIAPYEIRMQRVTWSPIHGLIIHGPELQDPDMGTVPVFRAESVFIKPDYRRLLQREWHTAAIGLNEGRFDLPVASTNDTAPFIDYIGIHSINGGIDMRTDETGIELTGITDIGTRCTVSGVIGRAEDGETEQERMPFIERMRELHRSIHATPPWMIAVRERIDEMVFEKDPELKLGFRAGGGRDTPADVMLTFSTGPFEYRAGLYDGIDIDARYRDGVVGISRAELRRGGASFSITGTYTPGEDKVEARMLNDLPMNTLAVFFPDHWIGKINDAGLRFAGTHHSEAWIGPCRLREAPYSWSGWIALEDAAIGDIPVEKAFAAVVTEPGRLTLKEGRIAAGHGSGAGVIGFDLTTDFSTRTTSGRLEFDIDLQQVRPLLPAGLKKLADDIAITTEPVHFNGTLSVCHTNTGASAVSGTVRGRNVSYRGVPLEDIRTTVRYDRRVLQLDPLEVRLEGGEVTGPLVMNFADQTYGLTVTVTTDPRRAAPAVGSNMVGMLRPYSFSDDTTLLIDGVVSAKSPAGTDLQVVLSGSGIGLTNLVADRMHAAARFANDKLAVTNFNVQACGGNITGMVRVVMSGEKSDVALHGIATNLYVDQLVKKFRPANTNFYDGILDGEIRLVGPWPDAPAFAGWTGGGALQIRDGQLMRIPIFGGLSTLLSKIIPGFGFAEQNHLTSSFTIGDGKIRTNDLKLMGSVISLSGSGAYRFTDDLDFNIKVKPLRQGIIASTVRIVTSPLSFLLEVNLSGPLRNPKWTSANIPLL